MTRTNPKKGQKSAPRQANNKSTMGNRGKGEGGDEGEEEGKEKGYTSEHEEIKEPTKQGERFAEVRMRRRGTGRRAGQDATGWSIQYS